MRYVPLDNFTLLVVDERECKITLKSKEYEQKFNIYVNDIHLAKALQTYFLTMWGKGERLEKKIAYENR